MTSATDTAPVRVLSTDGETQLEAVPQSITGSTSLFLTDVADGHFIEAVISPGDAQRLGESLLAWSKQ